MSELDEDSDGFLQPHVWTSQHMLMKFHNLQGTSLSHALIMFAGNGSIHQGAYSQFGTIARHAIGVCSNVLPHSCTEVLFLL
jgi:hypothetical protein